jgi:LPS-assembly lipoprotein
MKPIFLPLILLSLTACGFTPLYGEKTAGSHNAELAHIAVDMIPDREGQILRNDLLDRFYVAGTGPAVSPRYRLQVARVNESYSELDITKSAEATRGQLLLTSSMVLIDTETGAAVLTRPLRAVTSFNILTSEFATRVTRQNARENALADLARQIELATKLYLTSRQD